MCRAIFARRCPLEIGPSNWVSRMRTSANSAATKKPFSSTSNATTRTSVAQRMKASQRMLQFHLAKDHLEDVFQTHNPGFVFVARQHHGQALSASLHPLQRH